MSHNIYPFPESATRMMRQTTNLTNAELLDRLVWLSVYGESLTKARAARILGKTRQTVYNMIADGRLKTNKDGTVSTRSLWAYCKGVTA